MTNTVVSWVITPNYCQYDYSAYTARYGCGWTSVANLVRIVTGRAFSPDTVHGKVKKWEETDPSSPGWSIPDMVLATARLKTSVTLVNRTGASWSKLVQLHDAGYVLLVQGDSDQFSNGTCSGAFDGPHVITVHAEEDDRGWWLVYDPICQAYRFENPAVIARYAQKWATTLGVRGLLFASSLIKARRRSVADKVGYASVKPGTYTTYKTVNGQAVKVGHMKTAGLTNIRATAFRVIQSDGSGKATLVKLLVGAHAGDTLHRFAKGVTYVER